MRELMCVGGPQDGRKMTLPEDQTSLPINDGAYVMHHLIETGRGGGTVDLLVWNGVSETRLFSTLIAGYRPKR